MGAGKKDAKRPKSKRDQPAKRKAKLATKEARRADELETRTREAELRLRALQSQLDAVVASLDEATARLQATVALVDDLPTAEAATDGARELRQRLEQMLVAQRRTNELLDLALGVAVEAGDERRSIR